MCYDINAAADYYTYIMYGSSPCEDCNRYRHITSDEELQNFIECSSKLGCDYAKEYYEAHDNYVKVYNYVKEKLEKYDNK
jgi:hypothetical protein